MTFFRLGVKRVDGLILRYFLRYFAYVLPTLVLVFIIQYLLKYFDEFVGKGLGVGVFAQLIAYFAVNLLPIAIPLAILLTALITYGSLGEHAELTIFKAVGISPFRLLRPALLLAVLLAVINYHLASYIAPLVNAKAFALLHDIRRKKPSFRLEEKEFYNQIPGYSLRYERKLNTKGLLGGVMIYDHQLANTQSARLITADSGQMVFKGDTLWLRLRAGHCYTESARTSYEANFPPTSHTRFARMHIRLDLSTFSFSRSNEEYFQNIRYAKNISRLLQERDSLRQSITQYQAHMRTRIPRLYTYHLATSSVSPPTRAYPLPPTTKSASITDYMRQQHDPEVLKTAMYRAESIKERMKWESERLRHYLSELHHSQWAIQNCFALAVSCLIMFLAGGPLGIIVKKGGFGVPGIISTCSFIVFHVLMVTCNKYAREGVMDTVLAAWMANTAIATAAAAALIAIYKPHLLRLNN